MNSVVAIQNFLADLIKVNRDKDLRKFHDVVLKISAVNEKQIDQLVDAFNVYINENLSKEDPQMFDFTTEFIKYNDILKFNFISVFNSLSNEDKEIVIDHLFEIHKQIQLSDITEEEKYVNDLFDKLSIRITDKNEEDIKNFVINFIETTILDFKDKDLRLSAIVPITCKKAKHLVLEKMENPSTELISALDTIANINLENFTPVDAVNLLGTVSNVKEIADVINPMVILTKYISG